MTAERVIELAKDSPNLKELAIFISQHLRSQAITEDSKETLQTILKLCLAGVIKGFDLDELTRPGYRYRTYDSGISFETRSALGLLELCFTLQLQSNVEYALAHLLSSPKSNEPQYINDLLASVVKALPVFLEKHELTIADVPYEKFAAEVVTKFVRLVLGAKSQTVPLNDVRAVGCNRTSCQVCTKQLVPFLTSERRVLEIREKQSIRTHVEQQLPKTTGWDVTWKTLQRGSPYTLEVRHVEFEGSR